VKADPYLLDLRRSTKDPLINNNIIKADIFVAKFFLKTKIANFNNIKIETIIKQRAFNISFIILKEKINKLIRSFLNNKALGLDGILNKVFKVVVLVIIKDLAEIASHYFASGIILKSLKEFIIIVLYKERKKNYSPLGSYRLITLKNTLVKVLEKYIVNIILKTAEEHRLLLWN